MDYTIQHGTVIDGTGAARCVADVLIREGRIAEVAPHLPPIGEVIEARGMIVCPGFIDMHTHSQLVVFTEPDLPMKAAQGITTELFGQDGMATFPMVPQASAMWRTHLSGLDEDFAVGMITFMIGEDDIQNILRAPWRAMGTDGLLGGRPHPRAYGSCPRILGHYARDLDLLTLEEAIRKMTGLPAEILHLSDRGILQPGKAADVVVFNPQTICERSSYEEPRQYPEGIPYVFVNGRPVIAGGRSTGARPGHLLQHHG